MFERLALFGFVKAGAVLPARLEKLEPAERIRALRALPEAERAAIEAKLSQIADADELELVKDQLVRLPFPKPLTTYQIVYETPHLPIEPIYFWCLNQLRDSGFHWIEKITDIFAASEHSSFYGAAAQRIGLVQDRVATYLGYIGKFVREDLFKLVREMRWLDERIGYHIQARQGIPAAEITLKSIWADMVDGRVWPGGERVAANIFQMQTQAGFATLPDWFFATHPTKPEEIEAAVEALPTTKPVKSVLKNKLAQYLRWREENYRELKHRRTFTLRYLTQHYNIIRLYLAWIKPYLRQLERMQLDVTGLTKPELVAAFEGSAVELELLAAKLPEGNKHYWAVLLLSLEYRTKPSLSFMTEVGYHRGPIHVGESRIAFRAYAWTEAQIAAFKAFKEREDLELLGSIDTSIKATLDALGEDLYKYIAQAERAEKEAKPEAKPEKPKLSKAVLEAEQARAESEARKAAWDHYENFKKSHGMITW